MANKRFIKGNVYTLGQTYGVLVKAQTQEEATELFSDLLEYGIDQEPDKDPAQIEATMRSNLGYYAGYYSLETQQRVEKLYGAVHPIFGTSFRETPITPVETFQMGAELARKHIEEDVNTETAPKD